MKNREQGGGIRLEVSEDDPEVAYVKLPAYPVSGVPKDSRCIRLRNIIGDYIGPDINLDFDEAGVLVGIEILA